MVSVETTLTIENVPKHESLCVCVCVCVHLTQLTGFVDLLIIDEFLPLPCRPLRVGIYAGGGVMSSGDSYP